MRFLVTLSIAIIAALFFTIFFSQNATVTAQSRTMGKIAFTYGGSGNTSTEIYVINSDGTEQARLTNNDLNDRFPTWSPDGSQIAFESNREGGTYNIFRMNADGTNPIQLTNSAWPVSNSDPAWSPDGTKIAFVSNRSGSGKSEIWVMNADGSNLVKLTTSELYNTGSINPVYSVAREPIWSPDSTRIAFSSYRDGNFNLDIYVMSADGSNQTRLTIHPSEDREPSWSPNGTKIAFTSTRDGNHEVYVMDVDGSNQTNLTNFQSGNDFQPAWSPDGAKIAFVRLENKYGSVMEIYRMNPDGSSQTKITNNLSDNWTPAWQAFSSTPTPTPTPTPTATYSVSGRVADISRFNGSSSPGLGGIMLTLSGTVSATTQTDINGNYFIGNLPENGTFTIKPTTTSWGYYPQSQTFTTSPQAFGFVNRNLTVNFDAQPIFLEFITANYSAYEGSNAVITVIRNGYITGISTIDYATSDGSASSTSDYIPTSGTLQFAPGETMKSFTVPIIYDAAIEGSETINLTLSNPTGSISRGRVTAVLTIDDPFPVLLIEQNSSRVVALDSVTLTRDPFPLITTYNFSLDHRTRIMLFAMYVDLLPNDDASVVTAQAEDSQRGIYQLPVEFIGKVPNFNWLTQVIVRLPDNLPTGEAWVNIRVRGKGSNRGQIRIR